MLLILALVICRVFNLGYSPPLAFLDLSARRLYACVALSELNAVERKEGDRRHSNAVEIEDGRGHGEAESAAWRGAGLSGRCEHRCATSDWARRKKTVLVIFKWTVRGSMSGWSVGPES
jgi:hypothetical protein